MVPPLPVTEELARRGASVVLDNAALTRYSRHILLPEVGRTGQQQLAAARVLIVGAGGLGAPVSLYLAAAGVGTIGLVEFDTVDVSNLQRQILYTEGDAGQAKLSAATARLRALNSAAAIGGHAERLTAANAMQVFTAYDIIVDATDNFPTRYLISDACVLLGKPCIYGAIYRFDGQVSVFYPPQGPCYRCLFPSPPPPGQTPNCAEGGVLGVLPGQVGTIQATEVLKLILGIGEPLLGRLLLVDALSARYEEFRVPRDDACAACGAAPTITGLAVQADATAVSCLVPLPAVDSVSVHDLVALRRSEAPFQLVDVRTAGELAICRIADSLHVPLAALPHRLAELRPDAVIIVYCKSGARSAQAVRLLHEQGFTQARSLAGGILAWIEAVAPELPKY